MSDGTSTTAASTPEDEFFTEGMIAELDQKVEGDVLTSERVWNNGGATAETLLTTSRNKQLIILAGPQGSSELLRVQEFLVQHASDYRPQHKSIKGWEWPTLDYDKLPVQYRQMEHPKVFDLLVAESTNVNLQSSVLTQLESTWRNVEQGMILGSEYFDQWPLALPIMERLVDQLELDYADVTVVLAYPASPAAHWKQLWQRSAASMDYREWMCNPALEPSHLERLETSMNVLGISTKFRQDFSVRVLDLQGIAQAQVNVAHVLACRVMQVEGCHQDWLVNVTNISHRIPTTVEILADTTIDGVSKQDLQALEDYFLDRDCSYQHALQQDHPGFEVLYKNKIFNNCESTTTHLVQAYYERLTDPTVLWKYLRDQLDCGDYDYSKAEATSVPTIPNGESSANESTTTSLATADNARINGWVVATIMVALAAVLVGIWRLWEFMRRRRRQQQSTMFREWKRGNEQACFSAATLRNSVVLSGASSLSSKQYPFWEENIQSYHDEEQYDNTDNNNNSLHNTTSTTTTTSDTEMPSIPSNRGKFQEIDLCGDEETMLRGVFT